MAVFALLSDFHDLKRTKNENVFHQTTLPSSECALMSICKLQSRLHGVTET